MRSCVGWVLAPCSLPRRASVLPLGRGALCRNSLCSPRLRALSERVCRLRLLHGSPGPASFRGSRRCPLLGSCFWELRLCLLFLPRCFLKTLLSPGLHRLTSSQGFRGAAPPGGPWALGLLLVPRWLCGPERCSCRQRRAVSRRPRGVRLRTSRPSLNLGRCFRALRHLCSRGTVFATRLRWLGFPGSPRRLGLLCGLRPAGSDPVSRGQHRRPGLLRRGEAPPLRAAGDSGVPARPARFGLGGAGLAGFCRRKACVGSCFLIVRLEKRRESKNELLLSFCLEKVN